MNQRNLIVNVSLNLHTLSRTEQGRCDYMRAVCEQITPEIVVTPTLQALARTASGSQKLFNAEEVLAVFFEADATALLLQVPNRYWFWKLMDVTALMHIGAEPARFTRSNLHEAVLVLRGIPAFNPLLVQERLEKVVDDAAGSRETKIALRTAAGLVVLVPSTDRSHFWLVDNPVFFEPAFIS